MDASAEGVMWQRFAEDVESVRIVPPVLVAVRGADQHLERLSFAKCGSAQFHIFRDNPALTLHRRLETQNLLDSRRNQFATLSDKLQLIGMADEKQDAVGKK